jgi:hypothetical protein
MKICRPVATVLPFSSLTSSSFFVGDGGARDGATAVVMRAVRHRERRCELFVLFFGSEIGDTPSCSS